MWNAERDRAVLSKGSIVPCTCHLGRALWPLLLTGVPPAALPLARKADSESLAPGRISMVLSSQHHFLKHLACGTDGGPRVTVSPCPCHRMYVPSVHSRGASPRTPPQQQKPRNKAQSGLCVLHILHWPCQAHQNIEAAVQTDHHNHCSK